MGMTETLREKLNVLLGRRKPVFLRDRKDLKNYEIGRGSYGNLEVIRYRLGGKISIGSFCSFAEGTVAMLGGDHNPRNISTYPFGVLLGGARVEAHASSKGDIRIGNDVWLGRYATVMAGVTIADGAVIGAHSLVTRDVPPYAIAAGNPARVVRMRFPDDTIAKLLKIKWWDWPDSRILEYAELLLSEDMEEFLLRAFTQP